MDSGAGMNGIQAEIARRTGKSPAFVSMVFSGKARVALWRTAQLFAKATNTSPQLWLERPAAEIRAAVKKSMGGDNGV